VEIDCEHFECEKTVLRRELEEHLKGCEYRLVTCEWCEDDAVVFNELEVRFILDGHCVCVFGGRGGLRVSE